jgi:hypothetical protein
MRVRLNQFAALNNIGRDAGLILADGANKFARQRFETAMTLQHALFGNAPRSKGPSRFEEPTLSNATARVLETAASYPRDAYDIASGPRVRPLEWTEASSTELTKELTRAATQSAQLAAIEVAASAVAQATQMAAPSNG